MWVMTTGGFVSAVAHRADKSMLMVRARDRKSLENMLQSLQDGLKRDGQPELNPLPEIQSQPKGVHWDYPHRVVISKVHFEYFLIDEVEEYLDYANFKSEATVARGKAYHDALMNVWTDMRALTEPEFKPAPYKGAAYKVWGPSDYSAKGSKTTSYGLGTAHTTGGSEASGSGAKGSVYTWGENGEQTSRTPLMDDIHSLPLDVDPTALDWDGEPTARADGDDIVDVDEDGAPVHARSSIVADLGELNDDEINELDEVLLAAGFHLDDERSTDIDEDDELYRVDRLTDGDRDDDARFEAWLARNAVEEMQRYDTGAYREDPALVTSGSPIELVDGVAYYTESGEPVHPIED